MNIIGGSMSGAFCASLQADGRAALHDAYRRRLGVADGPFELTARAWAVAGTASGSPSIERMRAGGDYRLLGSERA